MSAARSSTLGAFQRDFARALLAEAPARACPPALRAIVAQPGFAVYRNTVTKGCIDALRANHPAVAMLVGDDWFEGAARAWLLRSPPRSPVLLDYGAGFAGFLDDFPPAAGMRWIADVARLDRAWGEAHAADDEAALDPAALAALPPERLAAARLRPHAAARWAWFADAPVVLLWRRNRCAAQDAAVDLSDLAWAGGGVLLTRPGGPVEDVDVDAAHCAFLDACAAGKALGESAAAALAVDARIDLARLVATLLRAGAFAAPASGSEPGEAT